MKHSQSVAAAAADAAAADANCSKALLLVQVEVLRVSRIMFDPLSEKLPCRCNLPAQDCVRLFRWIPSSKILIHDLAHETILPVNSILVVFPVAVVVHLPWY